MRARTALYPESLATVLKRCCRRVRAEAPTCGNPLHPRREGAGGTASSRAQSEYPAPGHFRWPLGRRGWCAGRPHVRSVGARCNPRGEDQPGVSSVVLVVPLTAGAGALVGADLSRQEVAARAASAVACRDPILNRWTSGSSASVTQPRCRRLRAGHAFKLWRAAHVLRIFEGVAPPRTPEPKIVRRTSSALMHGSAIDIRVGHRGRATLRTR